MTELSRGNPNDVRVLSRELRDLAGAIRDQLKRIEGSTLALGRNLLRARQLAKRGEWLPFLEAAGIHERTAQKLIRFAQGEVDGKVLPGMSMTAFLEAEATPRTPAANNRGGEDPGDGRDAIREAIDERERRIQKLQDEIAARDRFPDADTRIAALEAEGAALRVTRADLQREAGSLHRQMAALYERSAHA